MYKGLDQMSSIYSRLSQVIQESTGNLFEQYEQKHPPPSFQFKSTTDPSDPIVPLPLRLLDPNRGVGMDRASAENTISATAAFPLTSQLERISLTL